MRTGTAAATDASPLAPPAMEDAAPTAARLTPGRSPATGADAPLPAGREDPQPADAAHRPAAGADRRPGDVVLGRYALVRILGQGGAGTVWMAEDQSLGRPVAVKCLPAEGGRALHEARAAARMSHPTVVGTYGLGDADGCTWIVTEFVPGDTLRRTIKDDTHTDDELLQIGVALCVALRHAHEHGIVHRDVTPRNVLVPADAFPRDAGRNPGACACHPHVPPAKLADFGIARPTELHEETRKGRIVGTLSYMAPERLTGGPGDEAGDLWALGVVLHEALVGEHPAGKPERAGALVRQHADLPSLAPRRPDLPGVVVAAVDRAVQEDPARRGTVADLERALRAGLAERGVPVAPALREQSTRDLAAVPASPATVRPPFAGAAPLVAATGALLGPALTAAVVGAVLAMVLTAVAGGGPASTSTRRLAAGVVLLALAAAVGGLVVGPLVETVAGGAATVAGPVLAAGLAVAAGRGARSAAPTP